MKQILLISGPSGIGKTYLGAHVMARYPESFVLGRLFTTRPLRLGEEAGDRLSITPAEFERKRLAGDFLIVGEFHNNFYGYPKELFITPEKHVIINTWPALLPEFINIPGLHIAALVAPDGHLERLEARMLARGDDPQKVAERRPLMRADQTTLRELSPLISDHGKLFTITSDETIGQEIIPWVEETFGLQT